MPTLIHISDLHFGPHHHAHLDEIILKEIAMLNPDVVITSGDFTMRARHREFEQARDFLAHCQADAQHPRQSRPTDRHAS